MPSPVGHALAGLAVGVLAAGPRNLVRSLDPPAAKRPIDTALLAMLPMAALGVLPDVDLPTITRRATEVGHVDLHPGYVPMDEVADLFAAHRVVVFTYATVNISGSVHMAYTFGRPVVATDVGSMSDAVQDGVTGLLTAPEPAAVARALVEILGDPGAADRMGAQGARRVDDAASWTTVVDKAVPAYRDAVNAQRG